jgi:hypothetical protein
MIGGESIHDEEVQRNPDVVTQIEERYMFFAKQADVAREQVSLGRLCTSSASTA